MIIGITGHRKLNNIIEVENRTRDILLELKPDKLISGMAVGYDTIAVKICIELNIPFIAAVPFLGQDVMWPMEVRREYEKLIKLAESVHYCCNPGYAAWKMQKRNEWIVDNCDILIACWDGRENGGTYNCLSYAKIKNKDIMYIKS